MKTLTSKLICFQACRVLASHHLTHFLVFDTLTRQAHWLNVASFVLSHKSSRFGFCVSSFHASAQSWLSQRSLLWTHSASSFPAIHFTNIVDLSVTARMIIQTGMSLKVTWMLLIITLDSKYKQKLSRNSKMFGCLFLKLCCNFCLLVISSFI